MSEQNRYSLSVIVITYNEATLIERCLRSVQWADEIIIVDSGSTDDTRDIATQLGAIVHNTAMPEWENRWPGFGAQKNRTLSFATKDWVLSIDADEYLSTELSHEIQDMLRHESSNKQNLPCAFTMPRRSSFLGQPIMHAGWWPDPVLRLFKRGSAEFSNDVVHERLLIKGNADIGKLTQLLEHESYRSLEQVLQKMQDYSTAGATQLMRNQKSSSLSKAVLKGLWAFVRSYFLRLGFLEGKRGFILAVYNAETTYYKYLKLWLEHETK
jgi:glycosyltransferase involved in cell wall biosynthesis